MNRTDRTNIGKPRTRQARKLSAAIGAPRNALAHREVRAWRMVRAGLRARRGWPLSRGDALLPPCDRGAGPSAAWCFNLANVLYRLRRKVEAVDFYRQALRA